MYGMYTNGMYSIIARHIEGKEKLHEQGFVVFDLDDF